MAVYGGRNNLDSRMQGKRCPFLYGIRHNDFLVLQAMECQTKHLRVDLLKFFVLVRKGNDLRWAHECEIQRIEEQDQPFAWLWQAKNECRPHLFVFVKKNGTNERGEVEGIEKGREQRKNTQDHARPLCAWHTFVITEGKVFKVVVHKSFGFPSRSRLLIVKERHRPQGINDYVFCTNLWWGNH